MAIKVYFGPYKHSPADELPHDERRLWLTEFHLLKGVDQDFWTSNSLQLDAFDESQVMVWQADKWVPLDQAADALMPNRRTDGATARLPNGRLAIGCELLWYMREAEKATTMAASDDG